MHVALYGNVGILRGFCPYCKRTAFILDELWSCCDRPCGDIGRVTETKRESQPEQKRGKPSKKRQEEVLRLQNYRCLYCDQVFGSVITYKGKLRILKCVWDHQVPYTYNQDSRDGNFVAACQPCNSWKSGKLFQTVEEVQIYVQAKWEEVQHWKVRPVRRADQASPPVEAVLLPEVPITILVEAAQENLRPRGRVCPECGDVLFGIRRTYCGAGCRYKAWDRRNPRMNINRRSTPLTPGETKQ